MPFSLLIKLSAFLKYGLLVLVAGVGLMGYALISDHSIPQKNDLQQVAGAMTGATRVTTKRKRGGESVKYELTFNTKEKGELKATIPYDEINEMQVRSLFGKALVITYDGDNDIYALTANNQPVMTYENTVKARHKSNASLGQIGIVLASLGGLGALVGFFLARRKARRLMEETAQPASFAQAA
jgi:hypothetical protein